MSKKRPLEPVNETEASSPRPEESSGSLPAENAQPELESSVGLLSKKVGLVMGLANDHSIAWALSEALYAAGAELAFTHLPSPSNERRVRNLVEPKGAKMIYPCDVQNSEDIVRTFETVKSTYGRLDFLIHSIAFAPPLELKNPYVNMSRAGWHLAMDISVYSLVAVCRQAAPLMTEGGSIITVSYYGGEKVVPGYNVMGVCKAALEHSVRYLAWDLGSQKIRVNAISAGPVRTLSSAGISHFDKMRQHASKKAPLGRDVEMEDLGNTGVYLLSHLSAGVTGEILHVDCGYNIIGL
jgi:enoyl-[acyl-carrier protein] reductase I